VSLLGKIQAAVGKVQSNQDLNEVRFQRTLVFEYSGHTYTVRCSITDPNKVDNSVNRATLMDVEVDVRRDTRLLRVHPEDLEERPPVGAEVAWDGRTLRVVSWSQASEYTGQTLGTCLLEG